MQISLEGMEIAVLGGDARELALLEELSGLGARLNVAGLPVKSGLRNVFTYSDPGECLNGVDAVILPVSGVNERGFLYCALAEQPLPFTRELAAKFPANIPVFVGVAGPLLTRMALEAGLRLIELMKRDEVAILNSIPTAEGAIQMAMEILPVTIHGCSAFVLGFGRTGATLARLLGVMGAKTSVLARRPEYLARITELNLRPLLFKDMAAYLEEADVIFNTVPALVLTGELLERLSLETVVIDLASAPGGVDFQKAESMGIKAVLAPGLPGKAAPRTAGKILAQVITRLLLEESECS